MKLLTLILLSLHASLTTRTDTHTPDSVHQKSYELQTIIKEAFIDTEDFFNSGIACVSKIDSLTRRPYYPKPEKPAENIGGLDALRRGFEKNVILDSLAEYPVNPSKIAWVVEADGKISGERILGSTDSAIGLQMIAVVKSFKWTPAECNGKKVPSLLWQSIYLEFDR